MVSFNIYKISYWSRTVLVPLLIIMRRRPVASNPNKISITELFLDKKIILKKLSSFPKSDILSKIFIYIDKVARLIFSLNSNKYKNDCEEIALKWIIKRLNGLDGLEEFFQQW